MIEEQWRDIPDIQGYQISDRARVRQFISYSERYRYLVPELIKDTLVVSMRDKGQSVKYALIDLMEKVWVQPINRPYLYKLTHIDGNSDNCRLENLGWQRKKIRIIEPGTRMRNS